MAGSRAIRRFRIPLQHSELQLTALYYEPMARAIGNPPANFAPEFLERGHEVFDPLWQLSCAPRSAPRKPCSRQKAIVLSHFKAVQMR